MMAQEVGLGTPPAAETRRVVYRWIARRHLPSKNSVRPRREGGRTGLQHPVLTKAGSE